MKNILIKGARVHNLKNIDVSIPKNKLVAATGVSGSGKSSLVFDILFEEGRKQYLQSLGILAGLDDGDRFDSIQGLCPTIAVQQNIIRQSNARSTVGTRSSIINMLALLYATEGQMLCSCCGSAVNDSLACPNCGNMEERLPPSYFSYNSPNGMCIHCSGCGARFEINLEKLVPDNRMALGQVLDGAGLTPGYLRLFKRKFNEHLDIPFLQLPEEVQSEILYGHFANGSSEKRSACLTKIFHYRLRRGDDLNGMYAYVPCPDCHGFRVGEEARRVLLNGKHIGDLGLMTVSEVHTFLEELLRQNRLAQFGKNLLQELLRKTNTLIRARLGHLSLYREMPTLSGGEIQRLFLHSHLDSKMDSLIYVLDEPTAGLHEAEKTELLQFIRELKELGNTVIIVEHDKNAIKMAEHILDIGPKAGIEGGQIVYQGDLEGLLQCEQSITGRYLSGKIAMPLRSIHRQIETVPSLTIRHAKTNNLKDVTVSVPLGVMVGIAGMSGSGKSSLVSDTLIPLLKSHFHDRPADNEENEMDDEDEAAAVNPVADRLEGMEHIGGYAEISQAPIGRNVNSNPATYIGYLG